MCSFYVHFYIEYTPFENTKRWHGHNTFEILLLSDANMIGEHKEKRTKMTNRDTFLKKSTNGTFKALQMKVFGPKNFQIPCRESKVPNWQFLMWHFWFPAWNLKFFVSKYLHLKCFECAISRLFQKCVSVSSKSRI